MKKMSSAKSMVYKIDNTSQMILQLQIWFNAVNWKLNENNLAWLQPETKFTHGKQPEIQGNFVEKFSI